MTRNLITCAMLALLQGCAAGSSDKVQLPATPLHSHVTADRNQTCAWQCSPWRCIHAFDVDTQSPGDCQAEGPALCVCAPDGD